MHLISQTLPVLAPCICNTARGSSADRWLHTACNNKHATQEETRDPAWLPVLIGNPSSPCWPSNFHGPVWVTHNTVELLDVLCTPVTDTEHCFPLSPPGLSETRKDKQSTELGTKFVLLPNEVQPPELNIIHHTPAAVLVCELVCVCAERLLHICISASLHSCFHFSVLRTAGAQMTLRWPNKRVKQSRLFSFFLSVFSLWLLLSLEPNSYI